MTRALAGLLLIGVTLLQGGCASEDLGYGVALTLRFDSSVADADLGPIGAFSIVTTGDEAFTQTVSLGRLVKREERVLYRPSAGVHALEFTVTALGAGGEPIARGTKSVANLVPDRASHAEVVLTKDTSPDGGSPTDGGTDGATDGPIQQIAFQAAAIVPTLAAPTSPAVADLDGDGRPDLALVVGDAVHLYFAQPGGTLPDTPSRTIPLPGATAVVAVDVDVDGHVDVVATDASSAHVFRSDGIGNFKAASTFGLGGVVPGELQAADFDADGKADLLIIASSGSPATVRWGTGSAVAAFVTSTVLAGARPTTRAKIIDLDGDGALDVVLVQTAADGLETYRNTRANTARSFGAGVIVDAASAPTDVVFADTNGDGNPEALVACHPTNYAGLKIFQNVGGALLPSGTTLDPGVRDDLVERLALVDLDGDGIAELLSTHAGTAQQQFLRVAKGLAPFTFETQATFYSMGSTPTAISTVDLDGDSRKDVIVLDVGHTAPVSDTGIAVAHNLGAAGLAAAIVATHPPEYGGGKGIVVADVDQDGHADLVFTDYVNGFVFFGDGMLRFTPGLPVPLYTSTATAVGDLNGDGRTDLVIGGQNGMVRSLLAQQGGRTGSAASAFSVGSTLAQVGLADFNADGKLDLVFADYTAGVIGVEPGLGDGTFGPAATATVPGAAVMMLVDLDGDGDKDVVALSYNSTLYVVSNPLSTVTAITNAITAFAVIDFDRDGKLDLVAAGNGLSFFGGNGDGTFASAPTFVLPSAVGYTSMVAADVDRDGQAELVATTSSSVEVFKGIGAAFSVVASIPLGETRLLEVTTGDLDGDGLADIVVNTGNNTGGVTILRNVSR